MEPSIFQTDLGIFVAPAKWDALSDEAKTILTETAVAFEKTSRDEWLVYTDEVNAKLEAAGMEVMELEGEARDAYVTAAHDSVWNRLQASGSPYYEDLRRTHFSR
ncbi:hypothetical protein [Paracoccus sp. NSM]|uniref:hypothetical protein n=1 Tax=Paracoccus sp. NSM TaxID=3457784 RepID=UPI0040364102